MKALIKKEPKVGLWMGEVDKPSISDHELLIRIKKTAVCGTDLHIYNWDQWSQSTIKTPLVIGHEFVGAVAEIGKSVQGFQVGDRVSGEGHITCGHCRNCRAGRRHFCRNTVGIGIQRMGAFAEYLTMPAVNAFKIDASIPDEIASIFDPYGNAVHTALTFDLVGEDVLITGAGPIGIMATAIAKHVGARYVVTTDVNENRLKLAKDMGATRVVNPSKEKLPQVMKELGMTEGFDVGLEMSGNPSAFSSMIDTMNHGGNIALLGLFSEKTAIDWDKVIFKSLTIRGIYGREMFETWYKMAAMLQSGLKIDKVITHKFPFHQFEKAFTLMNKGEAAKVILDWEV
ncbi:MAG: L-threonine 3-dehydrogenase [Deltaproteobacteria bacterium]|nr:L-threonine 3-dehydrogenase [Deltaproteobacteria bacterium]